MPDPTGQGGKVPKKAKKPSTAATPSKEAKTKKYMEDIKTERRTKQQKSVRKVTELKNPTDVTIDSQKAKDEMGLIIGTTRESFASAKRKRIENDQHQRAVARKLIPKRENQTKNTLAINGIHGKMTDFNQIDQVPESSLSMDLIKINLDYHKERNISQFPLEKLVSLGLLTAHVPPLYDKQGSLSRQLGEDSNFIRTQLEHLTGKKNLESDNNVVAATTTTTKTGNRSVSSVKKVVIPGSNQSSATVKLSLVAGNMETVLGYKRNSSASQKCSTFEYFDRDKIERGEACFLLDPLEDESPFGGLPNSYNMFRSLKAEMEIFEKRGESMKKQSSLVGKTDLEEINRDYFPKYRRRPRSGEAACLNGTNCLFYTYSNDPEIRYIGRVFYTPNEEKSAVKKKDGLCIDCLLSKWTLHVDEMKDKSIPQSHPINHFGVLVGVGQYNQSCMLDVSFNDHQTGIVGCVPKYSENFRDKGVMSTRDPVTDVLIQEKYICESNMDF